jgi:hypothetical protein
VWFRLPEGTNGIAVEHETFECEIRDDEGRGYFRAPDRFATLILEVPGFIVTTTPPEGAPEDLPRADPLRDGAIAQLTQENQSLRWDLQNMRSDLEASRAKSASLESLNDKLSHDIKGRDNIIAGLNEKVEDKE